MRLMCYSASMADNSRGPSDRKPRLAAPLILAGVLTAVLIGLVITGRDRDKATPPAPAALPAAEQAPPPTETLGRPELINAAAAASAAYAQGAGPAAGLSLLVGRAFELRIPIGCDGPSARTSKDQAIYSIDLGQKIVRLRARPQEVIAEPIAEGLQTPDIESIEAFWLPRPWSPAEGCPPTAASTDEAPPTPPSLGVARIFRGAASRAGRHAERPYEYVLRVADAVVADKRNFDLVIEGRIAAFPDGEPTHCWAPAADTRPTCLIAADYDRVAFLDRDGRPLAEWAD